MKHRLRATIEVGTIFMIPSLLLGWSSCVVGIILGVIYSVWRSRSDPS